MQQTALYVVLGYGRIREQFGLPIGRFHAIAALVAQMSVDLYASDAARRYTAAALDAGEQPSLAGAILKVQLTEAGRRAVTHGMDILGGKGIIRGPKNLLGVSYRHAPIAITVEGANLLTRALIIFGQGAIRCHPHVLAEMKAVETDDAEKLGRELLAHARHVLVNLWASVVGAGVRGSPPTDLGREAAMVARLSASFALTADLAMGLLGGKLKRLELLSARLGDVLSCLYLAATAIWRYQMEGQSTMLPFARASIRSQVSLGTETLRELWANLPSSALRIAAPLLLRGLRTDRSLKDRELLGLSESLREDPSLAELLCPDLGVPKSGGLRDLMRALELAVPVEDELTALNAALRRSHSFEKVASGARDSAAALAYLRAADQVIQVDDFEA
jgi:acyl-CoA dehydrogenase